MTERRVQRRLAAILAADVAGSSRLMGADEVGTLAALKAPRREIVNPSIAEHQGRMVKTTGDGMLVEAAVTGLATGISCCSCQTLVALMRRNKATPQYSVARALRLRRHPYRDRADRGKLAGGFDAGRAFLIPRS